MGPVKIIDHYHNFLFFINQTQIFTTYKILLNHSKELPPQEILNSDTRILESQLSFNLDRIDTQLRKFDYKRSKRGLINGIGTLIKFIAGNPDNNDLRIINSNLDELHKNQNLEIVKVNELVSFANHITKRFENEIKTINKNLDITKSVFDELQTQQHFIILLQERIKQTEAFLSFLFSIERTISLALHNIPNLEIINVHELVQIYKFLNNVYSPQQLLVSNTTNLYQLLEGTRVTIFNTVQTITILLKIPIIKPFTGQLFRIYPIPDEYNNVILPPMQYSIRTTNGEFWTKEECKSINNFKLCSQQPVQENCSTIDSTQCIKAKTTNNYNIIHTLGNNQLLTATKETQEIIEDCHGIIKRQFVQGTNLINSNCKIIIGTTTYSNTTPTFEIKIPSVQVSNPETTRVVNFEFKHLLSPVELKNSITELQPANHLHYTQTTVSFLSVILTLILFITIITFRKRIWVLLCKKKSIIILNENQTASNSNIQSTSETTP